MRYLLLTFGLILLLPVACFSAQAQSDVILDSFGVWTLKDLGYSEIFLPYGEGIQLFKTPPYARLASAVKYVLPEGVSQGPETWYIIHYHFEVEFDPQTPDGKLTVLANTNGPMAAAMIRFYASYENGALVINWKSLGLVDGWQEGTSVSGKVEVNFSNYLPNDGVKPGDNHLFFVIKEEGDIKASMFHVFDDTSIEVTPLAPPSLSIEAEGWHPPVGPGDTFEVDYTVKNTGGWPARDVITRVSFPEDSLQLIGEPTTTMPPIDGSASQQGKFTFKVLSPGTHSIRVDVDSGTGGHDAIELIATIDTEVANNVSRARFWLLLGLVFALSALPLVPFGKLLDFVRGRR
ncbi:MAG: CARDB domain-containing protein [Bacillota bacterium]|nr:CARDB domain-containing protein [Bacillota bacterium]